MKRISSASLALASLLAAVSTLPLIAARPRYGGTIRVELLAAPRTVDPADATEDAESAAARARLLSLVVETLVRVDDRGRFEPLLAQSWQKDAQGRRWEFQIRPGVRMHDGAEVSPTIVAAALQRLNAGWTVKADGGTVRIDAMRGAPDLLWELADPRAGIATVAGTQVVGTGPFRIERWEPGRQAVLRAHDGYRDGRPFLDAIQFEMGRRPADMLADLELGRADIVSVFPQDARRIEQRGLRMMATSPAEVVALVVGRERAGGGADQSRRALALALDRAALAALLQRRAEPTVALLPQWLSGYAFLFKPGEDRRLARALSQSLPASARSWRMQFDDGDPVLQSLAGRIVVDAREAGLAITVVGQGTPGVSPDLRLVRARLRVAPPDRALRMLLTRLGVEPPAAGPEGDASPSSSTEAAWQVESSLVERHVVLPLVHLRELFGVSTRVVGWSGPARSPAGAWNLEHAWLRVDRP